MERSLSNPFRIGERVSGEFFTDRSDELRRVLAAMREPTRLLVYGPRRFGKSSLIEMAAARARDEGRLVVRADLGGATGVIEVADRLLTSLAGQLHPHRASTLQDWIRALSLELTIEPSGTPVLRFGVRAAPPDDPLPSLGAVLDRLEATAAEDGRTAAVVLDEFQRIAALGPDRAEWRLRDVMQGHHHVGYVCAGSEEGVIERLTDREGAFHGAFERLYLGSLPSGLEGWIEARVRAAGVDGAEGMGAAVVRLAGPRTEDVLKLARQVWFRAAARGRYERSDPGEAMADLVLADRGVFEKLWDGLTPHHRNVLRAVARGERALTSQAVRTRFDLKTSAAVAQAVDALVSGGALIRGADGVRFDDPFYRGWVERHLPPGL